MPPGISISDFVEKDGHVLSPEEAVTALTPLTLAQLKERYLETHSKGAMEANSLQTVAMHLGHVCRTLGNALLTQELALADLQRHIDERARKKYCGKNLSPVTLKKEITSPRAAWGWAVNMGLVRGPFPGRRLVYPKADEKPPFMTWPEIERRIEASGLTAEQVEELWQCLYLRKEAIEQLLAPVKKHAAHPWLYPLICTAAHAGARRSELLRMEVADVNLEGDQILIREKKRRRKQRTTRHVSLTPVLKSVLREYSSWWRECVRDGTIRDL